MACSAVQTKSRGVITFVVAVELGGLIVQMVLLAFSFIYFANRGQYDRNPKESDAQRRDDDDGGNSALRRRRR